MLSFNETHIHTSNIISTVKNDYIESYANTYLNTT